MTTQNETHLQTYGKFRPTQWDYSGDCMMPDQSNWLVAPVGQTRDSEPLDQSNFASCLKALGGESETVEVHRFGHWGPGWFEIILIDPKDTKAVDEAEQIYHFLTRDCVLDDQDFYEREQEAYLTCWKQQACREFVRDLCKAFKLADATESRLYDADEDALLVFFESLIPSGDYARDYYPRVQDAIENCSRTDLATFLKTI